MYANINNETFFQFFFISTEWNNSKVIQLTFFRCDKIHEK